MATLLFLVFHFVSCLVLETGQLAVCCKSEGIHLNCRNTSEVASDICGKNSNYSCYKMVKKKANSTTAELSNLASIKELHIATLVPNLDSDPSGAMAGMKLALEVINNSSDILDGFKLVLHVEGVTLSENGDAVKAFFNILEEPKKLMLIGSVTTRPLEIVAKAAPHWKLTQVSYGNSLPRFSQFTYLFTFRVAPSSISYSKAKASFIRHYGWRRVAIIYRMDPEYFSPTVEIIKTELQKKNITVIVIEEFKSHDDLTATMKTLKENDAHIIIGEFSNSDTPYVLCEASKHRLFGSNYVWILSESVETTDISDASDCNSNTFETMSNGLIWTSKNYLISKKETSTSGLTPDEFASYLWNVDSKIATQESYFAFDAIWAAAMALNTTLHSGVTYEQLTELSKVTARFLRNYMAGVSFNGLTGPTNFNKKSREREGIILLRQSRHGKQITIAHHYTSSDRLEIVKSEAEKIFTGQVPKDRSLESPVLYPVGLLIVTWVLALSGIVSSCALLYFNVTKRNTRIIKMSSPNLNNLILIGGMICFAASILFTLDARFLTSNQYGVVCNVKALLLSVGFSLSFGAIFSKTWRVHKIFMAKKTFSLRKMRLKDKYLFGFVAVLVATDVVFSIFWILFEPSSTNEARLAGDSNEVGEDIIPVLYSCTSQHYQYFLWVLYAYKGALLMFGIFLAWSTRNVTIAVLNDSRYIGMSVYNVFLLSTVGVITSTALDGTVHFQTSLTVSCLCIVGCTAVTLLLVFVPKFFMTLSDSETPAIMIQERICMRSTQTSEE